jgi:hypothetical protein
VIRWTITELSDDEWWATDAANGMAYELPSASGEALWRAGDPARPLREELARVGREPPAPAHDVDLRFAGVTCRYRCPDAPTAAQLARDFAAAAPALRATPEATVRLGPQADVDRLHRALPGPRADVWFQPAGAPDWTAATGDLPVLPPLQGTTLAARFVALHAALLLGARSTILVVGPQKIGKTTAALLAEELGLGTAATDELVLLGRHGDVYGVPLPLRVRSDAERAVRPIAPAPALDGQVRRASHVVLLARTDTPAAAPADRSAAVLADLVAQLRPLALPLGQASQLALELLAATTVWRVACRPWPELQEDLTTGLANLTEMTAA